MRRTFPTTVFAALTVLALGAAGGPARRHAHLMKSDPMADSTVAPPTAVRLWFSEEVEVKVSGVKVVDGSGAAVTTGPLWYDGAPRATSPVVATIAGALKSGTYKVQWVVASDDGHPVKGDFVFHVKAVH